MSTRHPTPGLSHPDCALPLDLTTDHAGLVLLGKFAQHLGLIERLQTVPLAQRTRTHSPQDKLIQFFVGILAGLDLYNGRQIMEAGIKEQKGVFTMRRPLVRSRFGLQLQEQLSVFAANFVRWAAEWAREQVVVEGPRLEQALKETKTLVRVVGQTRARLLQGGGGSALVFDAQGPFAGSVLIFGGQVAYQEVLPLFHSGGHVPDELRSPVIAQPLG